MFICKRCGVEFKRKSTILTHLHKSVICMPILLDIDRSILYNEFKKPILTEGYKCDFCDKFFKLKQTKYQHKKICKNKENKIENKELKEVIELLYNKVNKLEKEANSKITNICNNNNGTSIGTQNNNIQINVKDFANSENTSYIDSNFLLESFREMDLNKVIEEIHFNPDHPENHNVRIKNKKENLMEYIDNGKWVIKNKEEVLDHLIMSGYRVLNTYYRKNKEDIDEELEDSEIDESLGWLKKIYAEDTKLIKSLKKDAFLLVMNNKALLIQKK